MVKNSCTRHGFCCIPRDNERPGLLDFAKLESRAFGDLTKFTRPDWLSGFCQLHQPASSLFGTRHLIANQHAKISEGARSGVRLTTADMIAFKEPPVQASLHFTCPGTQLDTVDTGMVSLGASVCPGLSGLWGSSLHQSLMQISCPPRFCMVSGQKVSLAYEAFSIYSVPGTFNQPSYLKSLGE